MAPGNPNEGDEIDAEMEDADWSYHKTWAFGVRFPQQSIFSKLKFSKFQIFLKKNAGAEKEARGTGRWRKDTPEAEVLAGSG